MEVEVHVLLSAGAGPNKRFCFRAEALGSFKTIPFLATWDPLTLELYVECQLWESKETGEVKLKMSGTWVGDRPLFLLFRSVDCSWQEGSAFASHRGPFEAWDTLPLIDKRVALKFIMADPYLSIAK